VDPIFLEEKIMTQKNKAPAQTKDSNRSRNDYAELAKDELNEEELDKVSGGVDGECKEKGHDSVIRRF
jgi:bacteriocin-like protein